MAEFLRCNGYLCYEAGRAAACVSLCPPHALVMRAGEVVGEGRVEEGGVLFSDKRKSATPNREGMLTLVALLGACTKDHRRRGEAIGTARK